MCLPDYTCAQPFNITATETKKVSFNSNIEFVNGGIFNSNVTELVLYKLGSTPSEDQTLYQWCNGADCGNTTSSCRIDVKMSSANNSAPNSLTLRDLTMSDTGQYRVVATTASQSVHVPGTGFRRMSMDYDLIVEGNLVCIMLATIGVA